MVTYNKNIDIMTICKVAYNVNIGYVHQLIGNQTRNRYYTIIIMN